MDEPANSLHALVDASGREHGNPLPSNDARREVKHAVDAFEFAIGTPHHLKDEYWLRGDVKSFSAHQPSNPLIYGALLDNPAQD